MGNDAINKGKEMAGNAINGAKEWAENMTKRNLEEAVVKRRLLDHFIENPNRFLASLNQKERKLFMGWVNDAINKGKEMAGNAINGAKEWAENMTKRNLKLRQR